MFTRAFFTTLMIGLIAVGCSTKPKNSQDNAAATSADGSNAGLSLELNGDSDSNKAGGLKTVYFGYDSSNLDSSAKETLKSNADFMNSNGSVDIQVEGHCDERGGRQYNLALGERRAKAVRDHLVAMGVAAKRVSVVSYGNERPASEGHDESAWSKNRRGNFVVTAK
jgi:peptidoglycan-associated lipoprotein